MNSMPLVSVLITAYNRRDFIAAAIESVLASSLIDFELIVVDDGSTDGTAGIALEFAAKDPRIRVYLNEKNVGQFENRNKAAEYASGKYLKYVDSDDMILPGTLELMVAGMELYPAAGIGLVYNDMNKIDLTVIPYRCFNSRNAWLWHYTKGGMLFPGPTGCIFRKDHFFEQGGFPLHLGINGDIYLNLRIAAISSVVVFPGTIVFWRKHSAQVDQLQQDYFKMHQERFIINQSLLLGNSLPLSKTELSKIKFSCKVLFIRGAISHFLIRGKFKKFRSILKGVGIGMEQVPVALIPLRYINPFKK